MGRRYGVAILRINMVTIGIDFFTRQSNGHLLIFYTLCGIATSRSLKARSGAQLMLCVDKRFVYFHSSDWV